MEEGGRLGERRDEVGGREERKGGRGRGREGGMLGTDKRVSYTGKSRHHLASQWTYSYTRMDNSRAGNPTPEKGLPGSAPSTGRVCLGGWMSHLRSAEERGKDRR